MIDPDFLRFLIAERAEQVKVAPLHEVARLTMEANRAAALLAEIECSHRGAEYYSVVEQRDLFEFNAAQPKGE